MKTRNVLAVAMAAGCACTAFAQDGLTQFSRVERISPTYIVHNGVRYTLPTTTGGADDVQYVYENGVNATAGFFTSGAVPVKALDDWSFVQGPGAGAGRLITSVEVAFGTIVAVTQPMRGVDLRVEIFNNLDDTATPVNSGSAGAFILGFDPPAAGWANNTVYISNPVDLTVLAGGGVQTADDAGAFEYNHFIPDSTTVQNTDFTVPFQGAGVVVGTGEDVYWRDTNANGVYDPADARFFNGPPNLANMVFSMTADVPPLASGACCIAGGTCSVISQTACLNQGGIYAGDNVTCETANCAATGACCLLDGTCSLFDNGTCVSLLNGIFKGANTTCGSDCPAVFTYTGAAVSIPDGTGTTGPICGADAVASIVVPGPGVTIGAVDAAYFIQHTFQGDVTVTLTKGATSVILVDNVPFGNDNFGASGNDSDLFRSIDTAPRMYTTPVAGQDNVRGQWKPENPLSAFNGQNSSGTWELRVKDCFAQDTGTLNNFKLSISGSTGPTCYANCDNSTNIPFLNVLDFNCFLNQFNQGASYANCDNSTTNPTLNVLDFNCFLNKFNTGCTAP